MEPVVVSVGDVGPWAGALAVVWGARVLQSLAASLASIDRSLGAIVRALGLTGPELAAPPAAPDLRIILQRATGDP